ncbi:MAG TPA: sulfatase-like hydrolase/transferase [Vicinamibacterales bacterium]|nr:sulfatase-like hydrolase/transferase [Vicinamibacterales bacterium]
MRFVALLVGAAWSAGCGGQAPPPVTSAARPSILLVTLDTTRYDAIGPDASGIETPAYNRLVARGRRYLQAYATVPETLPSHTSMMTGLYPAGHGLHENARYAPADRPVLAERLHQAGYRTAAFVSAFALAKRFGLGRGFDRYDDEDPPGQAERSSKATTDAALGELGAPLARPLFLWVHYYDPHAPYAPPEPYRTKYASTPYLGEVAAMDEQLGRLIQTFDRVVTGPSAIVVVADHGEGLGDHGEAQHGTLLYQPTIHVPLVVIGPRVAAGVEAAPVSTRRIYDTVLDWAGIDAPNSLLKSSTDVTLAEAMKPFLEYGWQPQVMSVDGKYKAILTGTMEIYDLAADPGETRDLRQEAAIAQPVRAALESYPIPSPESARASAALTDEAKRKLATLGYIGATSAPVVRKDAPRPVDMRRIFPLLDQAAGLFAAGKYAEAAPLLEKILVDDPHNLDAALRAATAYSSLGQDARAVAMFQKAAEIAPKSSDVKTYLALHYARGKDWPRAVPLLEQVVAESPDRLPALEALATIRVRQGRIDDALALRQKIYAQRDPTPGELVELGSMAMDLGQTPVATKAFEQARAQQGAAFAHDLELGVLYLADRQFEKARDALDRVPQATPGYPMALFKRAQVSVLLHEPDAAARIALARQKADATTRELIAKERLFQNVK